MNISERREIAIGAVRAEAKRKGIKICEVDTDGALRILDDLARISPSLIASKWYVSASDYQIKLFTREWSRLQG